jgi:hypothetical protein
LPNSASNWTAISKVSSGIKLHVLVVAASSDSVFPEKVIPSTGNVADSDAVNHIIDADGALYVMDRGYAHKTKMGGWLERDVKLLVRVRKTFKIETLRSFTPTLPNVVKNEFVSILTCEEKLRYIEFVDQEGTSFHLITNRLDLSEEEVKTPLIIQNLHNEYVEWFGKYIESIIILNDSNNVRSSNENHFNESEYDRGGCNIDVWTDLD